MGGCFEIIVPVGSPKQRADSCLVEVVTSIIIELSDVYIIFLWYICHGTSRNVLFYNTRIPFSYSTSAVINH